MRYVGIYGKIVSQAILMYMKYESAVCVLEHSLLAMRVFCFLSSRRKVLL